MDKEPELKPCPFCGGKARLLRGMFNEYAVACTNDDCEFCGNDGKDYHEVINKWNTRPSEDTLRAGLMASYPKWIQDWINDPKEDKAWTELDKRGEIVHHAPGDGDSEEYDAN